jgi:hypothetical protein
MKKTTSVSIAVLAAAVLLSACGGKSEPAATAAAPEPAAAAPAPAETPAAPAADAAAPAADATPNASQGGGSKL